MPAQRAAGLLCLNNSPLAAPGAYGLGSPGRALLKGTTLPFAAQYSGTLYIAVQKDELVCIW